MEKMKPAKLAAITRRDITLCPRVYPVAEAMVRIAILDALYMANGYESLARLDKKWKKMGAGNNSHFTKKQSEYADVSPRAVLLVRIAFDLP